MIKFEFLPDLRSLKFFKYLFSNVLFLELWALSLGGTIRVWSNWTSINFCIWPWLHPPYNSKEIRSTFSSTRRWPWILKWVDFYKKKILALTDAGEDSKLVHRRIWPKCPKRPHAIYFSSFPRSLHSPQHRAQNTLAKMSHSRLHRLSHRITKFEISRDSNLKIPKNL